MDRLGPFEPDPALAVAVSGGADSMALALLARDWAAARGGRLLALVVDHGLRPESADETVLTVRRLTTAGIQAQMLRLTALRTGPALAERARVARYEVLTRACRDAGLMHLLVGHHAADQAETVAMRVLRGSHSFGLAGIAALRETADIRLLRPILTIKPACLRALLNKRGIGWIEDPSNQDRQALRPRLRGSLPPPDPALIRAVALAGQQRARDEAAIAATLADRVALRPQGFAVLSPGPVAAQALRALIRTVAGAPYPILSRRLGELAADPGPATLGGVRFMPAGRFGPGLLVLREEASIAAPLAAWPAKLWDNRFRLVGGEPPPGTMLGALGAAAARFRDRAGLPTAVLRTLPALWRDEKLIAVPHLRWADGDVMHIRVLFAPPAPLCPAEFQASASSEL